MSDRDEKWINWNNTCTDAAARSSPTNKHFKELSFLLRLRCRCRCRLRLYIPIHSFTCLLFSAILFTIFLLVRSFAGSFFSFLSFESYIFIGNSMSFVFDEKKFSRLRPHALYVHVHRHAHTIQAYKCNTIGFSVFSGSRMASSSYSSLFIVSVDKRWFLCRSCSTVSALCDPSAAVCVQ